MKDSSITLYNLELKVEKEEALNKGTLLNYQGQKARIGLIDGSVHEGFLETYLYVKDDVIGLWTFTYLNEETHKLEGGSTKSNDLTWEFIPVSLIKSVDLIMHSNPRWGGILTNKFDVIKPDPKKREQFNKEFMRLVKKMNKNGDN